MAQKEASLLLRIKSAGEATLDRVGSGLKALGGIAAGVFTAISAVAIKGVASYQASEEATNSLTQAMVNAGIYSKALQKDYLDQASALQKVTTYADEQIVAAQATMQMQLGELKITPELTKATLDLAAAKKIDLSSAAELVGKTIGTSTNALKRQGVELEVTGSKTEKMAKVTEELNRKFGGQAEAAAQGYGGIKQLANIIDDLFEQIGEKLQPTIGVFINMLKEMALDANKTGSTINVLVGFINGMAKAAVVALDILNGLGDFIGIGLAAYVEGFGQAIKGNFSAAVQAINDGNAQIDAANVVRIAKYKERMAALDGAAENAEKARAEKEKANLIASLDAKENIRATKDTEAAAKAQERKNMATEMEIELMGADEEQKLAIQISYLDKQIQNTENAKEKQRLIEEKYGLMRKQKMMEFEKAMTEYAKEQDELRTKNREQTLNKIATLQNSNNKTLAAIGKAAAITQIAIETPVAIARALAAFPPPFNFVAAGLVGAAMGVQAAQIAGVQLAEGGIVRARPGGIQATIGEGGQDEAVIPLDRAGEFGLGGGGITINVQGGLMGDEASAYAFAKAIDQQMLKLRRNNDSVSFDTRVT